MTTWTVRKAIFPIAGLGTRFLPATKASPKEMLPIVDKPLIQYAVEEAYAAGIRQMIFVTGRSKRAVEDHFDTAFELESMLKSSMKSDLLSLVHAVKPDDMECFYVRQPSALGLGHAVLCAEGLVGNEPFALLLADDLMIGHPPILSQMVDQFSISQTSIIAVQNVPISCSDRYGIVVGESFSERLMDIQHIIEKPSPASTPSTIAVVGRYIFTPGIFKEIARQSLGVSDEIQLTDGIASLLKREKVLAYAFSGTRYDCGTKLGFLQANVDVAEHHPEIGLEFSAWLETKAKALGI
ncbi:MAG TPA: UTP--glucose-1-phosphate uridylyltransferase [Legionella sp.]|nr:UTP--glucose-1-phosphate uridylyltransferase [Legionella sp.]